MPGLAASAAHDAAVHGLDAAALEPSLWPEAVARVGYAKTHTHRQSSLLKVLLALAEG